MSRCHVQVRVREGGNVYAWRRVRPSNGAPYVFTLDAARDYIATHVLQSGAPGAYRVEELDEGVEQ